MGLFSDQHNSRSRHGGPVSAIAARQQKKRLDRAGRNAWREDALESVEDVGYSPKLLLLFKWAVEDSNLQPWD
jgi:hypothetical protein